MPPDRMTNTVCVASNTPNPVQMAAVDSHSHFDERPLAASHAASEPLPLTPMSRIVRYLPARAKQCSQSPVWCRERYSDPTSDVRYCAHGDQNHNPTALRNCPPVLGRLP